MRIAILHNAVSAASGESERDVLDQVAAVSEALDEVGCSHWAMPCDLNLESLRRQLQEQAPQVVFNLVESLGGHDRLIHLVPSLLDSMRMPYTGSPAAALWATTDKLEAKRQLAAAGLPTSAVGGTWPHRAPPAGLSTSQQQGSGESSDRRWIVKSTWEHGSPALGDDAVVGARQLSSRLEQLADAMGGSCFAEEFIDGREFNISLLEEDGVPRVLPAVEMTFDGFPAGKPRIVGAAAKWQADSFEYQHTRHRFDFPGEDAALLDELTGLAVRCWRHFGLAGWARVDFRVDGAGRPYILEINANPCLTPGAGFSVALAQAGLSYVCAIRRILASAIGPDAFATLPKATSGLPRVVMQERGIPGKDLRIQRQERHWWPDSRMPGRLPPVNPSTARPYEVPSFRDVPEPEDVRRVVGLVRATGFFSSNEESVAAELVQEWLSQGAASGYSFLFADCREGLAGYACHGPIPLTLASWELYWIAVDPRCQGEGLGRRLFEETERRVRSAGATGLYLDTSDRPQYASTRGFYLGCGLERAAVLEGFYAPGDDKVIYSKRF